MKNFSVICFLILVSLSLRAQTFYPSVIYGTTNVTLTTNIGSSATIGTAKISGQKISSRVQHTALLSTTNFAEVFQISLDNANWTSVQTNSPSSTNSATIDNNAISTPNFTVYGRVILINTSTNVQGGGADVVLTPNTL